MNRLRTDARDGGAAAVEFALVLPILLLLVFGIIDFGRAYHAQVTLTHGAREGVRVVAFGGTQADVQARLDAGALTPGALGPVSISSVVTCGTGDAELVLVEKFNFITPLPGLASFYGGSIADSTADLTGKAVMRCGG